MKGVFPFYGSSHLNESLLLVISDYDEKYTKETDQGEKQGFTWPLSAAYKWKKAAVEVEIKPDTAKKFDFAAD